MRNLNLTKLQRNFGSIETKSSLVSSDPLSASGTVYGGIHTLTLIPGDGIGREMAEAVKLVFEGIQGLSGRECISKGRRYQTTYSYTIPKANF